MSEREHCPHQDGKAPHRAIIAAKALERIDPVATAIIGYYAKHLGSQELVMSGSAQASAPPVDRYAGAFRLESGER